MRTLLNGPAVEAAGPPESTLAGVEKKADRGTVLKTGNGLYVLVTIHPSALLRTIGQPDVKENLQRFTNDLRKIGQFLE